MRMGMRELAPAQQEALRMRVMAATNDGMPQPKPYVSSASGATRSQLALLPRNTTTLKAYARAGQVENPVSVLAMLLRFLTENGLGICLARNGIASGAGRCGGVARGRCFSTAAVVRCVPLWGHAG